MTVEWMRDKLLNNTIYSGSPTWKIKVNKMSDNQVVAVYNKFRVRGMFKPKKISKEKNYQMTIFDYGYDI